MSNVMVILDILIVTGLCVSAILACHFDNLLSAVIVFFIVSKLLCCRKSTLSISEIWLTDC